jgi:hypothetical protein
MNLLPNWALYKGRKINLIINSLILIVLILLAILALVIISWPAEQEIVYVKPIPMPQTVYYFSETICSKVVDYTDSIDVLIFRADAGPIELKYLRYDDYVINWQERLINNGR